MQESDGITVGTVTIEYRIVVYNDCTPAIYGMEVTNFATRQISLAVDGANAPIQSASRLLLHAYAEAMGWREKHP